MIPFFEKLSQIFTLIALSVIGLIVLLFVSQHMPDDNSDMQTATMIDGGGVIPEPGLPDNLPDSLKTIYTAGKNLFGNNCQQCHSPGADVVVGPGLKGIMDRRSIEWLVPWIQNSQKMIASSDPYAVKIYNQYNKTTMQSFKLSKEEIEAILAYINSYAPPAYSEAQIVVCYR